jgi:DNA replication and repair protein RecF
LVFRSLKLRNFRNYRELSLDIPSGILVFVGQNGQGKTNLIEAIYYLLRGESFRPATPQSLLSSGSDVDNPVGCVEARLERDGLDFDFRMTLGQGRRSLQLNHHAVSAAAVARQFPIVLFSPESLAAIKEGPEERRKLVDDVVITHSAASLKVLKDFRRALKTRNRMLKDFKGGESSRAQVMALLESLDSSFLPLATELTVERLKALSALQDDFKRALAFVLDAPDVDISVEYVISGHNAWLWSRSDILSAMHNRTMELRDRELETGASLVGPQRHDIRLLFTGKDSRFFCSQGQQRALILSFKMAQILYHHRVHQVYPFLLLDDVLSELDPARRSNLVKFLKGLPAQIFLTTTDLSFTTDFGDRRLNIFRIEKGTVKADLPSTRWM